MTPPWANMSVYPAPGQISFEMKTGQQVLRLSADASSEGRSPATLSQRAKMVSTTSLRSAQAGAGVSDFGVQISDEHIHALARLPAEVQLDAVGEGKGPDSHDESVSVCARGEELLQARTRALIVPDDEQRPAAQLRAFLFDTRWYSVILGGTTGCPLEATW
jgi:hypothetical protein